MKIFVTGGAGFIGRHLVKFLLEQNQKVVIYDDFSNSSEDNVISLTKLGAKVVKGDILDTKLVFESLDKQDLVIHLAAKTSVEESIKNPIKYHTVNVTGTLELLHACVKKNIKSVIVASSAAVYGNNQDLPLSENSQTIPVSPYGATKLAVEVYLQAFSHCFNLNCISLRLFNTYGTGQKGDYTGVITKFMEQISSLEPLTIFGDGSNTRDFVSVHDVVSAFDNAISNIEKKRGTFYNIASGKYTTIKDLAETMIALSGKDLSIQYCDARPGDILHSQTSIFRAKKDLGYNPKVELKTGLESLLKNT